jgi:uncharacterized protein (TIGR03437 family)
VDFRARPLPATGEGFERCVPRQVRGVLADRISQRPVVQPTVTLDSQNANIVYAGLTPTGIGLCQIDVTVPMNVRSGNLNLIVTHGGVVSNTAVLPVSN